MLVFVSYFAGIEGMVMSEWAEDKLKASSSRFTQTHLITSIACKVANRSNVNVIRVPSLSWMDFQWELAEIRKLDQRTPLRVLAWIPVAGSIGRVWDFFFARVSRNSAARWSWAFTALPIVILLRFRDPKAILFCTGGATGGHLLGLLAKIILKLPLFLEFQDPLLGSEMKRSPANEKGISIMERALIASSTRTVFVTKKAANSATERHPELGKKIVSIYPGAWKFLDPKDFPETTARNEIEILHLGTLYGARNLDNFFLALDNLRAADYRNSNRVCVKNLGDIYLDNKDVYLGRTDFKLLPPEQRLEALQRAAVSDALLLIQHDDSRSNETIPYKTFDYFNLRKPIIGVINNPELKGLLEADANYLADASSVESIQETLKRFLREFDLERGSSATVENNFDIIRQFARIFE